ncbi:MAG: HD domain-containing protein [Thermodesulfobacteriota bacterium]
MNDSARIATLSEGQAVAGTYLLLRCQLANTKNGKPYGLLRLGDRSGEIEGRLWDQAAELLGPLQPGMVVEAQGRVESYQGRLQVVLDSLSAAAQAQTAEFLPASSIPLETLQKGLDDALGRIHQRDLKRLLEAVFVRDQEFAGAFAQAPAAKGAHHAYVHGLLEHTVSVAGLASAVAGHYGPELEAELLLSGALLHDIGKVQELTLGPPIDYTDAGRLEGHVVLGVRMLDDKLSKLKAFPQRLAGQLRHLILSHHGSYEFGSPRRPKTAEALALNFLDDLDAKLFMAAEARRQAGPGHWSEYNRLLERFLYVGPSALPEPEAEARPGPAPGRREESGRPSLFDSQPGAEET